MKWIPLSKLAHGIAIYPFSPAEVQQATSKRKSTVSLNSNHLLQADNASIHTTTSNDSSAFYDQPSTNPEDYHSLISLEVGDEVFVIEQQGHWYRGYVLSTMEEGRKPNKAPLGCFPRSHVQIKEYVDMDPNELNFSAFYKRQETIETVADYKSGRIYQRMSSEFSANSALPRSYSEPYIPSKASPSLHQTIENGSSRRPGSFNEYTFDSEPNLKDLSDEKSSRQHIPPPPLPMSHFEQSTITGNSEPLIDEIAACINEWNSLLYTYIKERRYDTFNKVKDHVNYLFQARRQLLDQALSREELTKLRKEIIHKIMISNLEQNQDMIIRHPEKGYLLEPSNASLSTIYKMHWQYSTRPLNSFESSTVDELEEMLNNNNSSDMDNNKTVIRATENGSDDATDGRTQNNNYEAPLTKRAQFYHLFFELKAFVAHICQPGEFTELYFSLYSIVERRFITEAFVVILNYNGMPKDEDQIGKLQTIFSEIPLADFNNDNLYMVCKIIRLGTLKYTVHTKDPFGSFVGNNTSQFFHSNKHSNSPFQYHRPSIPANNLCKRPFGCAVLKLNHKQLTRNTEDKKKATTIDIDIPIYISTNEANFVDLHENIIFNHTKEYTTHVRAEKLRASLRTFYGSLDTIWKANTALFQGISRTLRLGFADVAFPNDNRNDLYVTLELGDLAQLGKSRNIQISMYVRDNFSGEVVEDAILLGSGTHPISYWESMVIYHEQKPRWNELIKVNIRDLQQWKRSHLFITVKHRSSHRSSSESGLNIPGFKKFSSQYSLNYHSNSQKNDIGSFALGNDKFLAMGFVPLFLPPLQRDFIVDGSHTLFLYKYDKQYAHPRFYLNSTAWCAKSTAASNTIQSSREGEETTPYNIAKNTLRTNSSLGRQRHRRSSSHHSLRSLSSSFTSAATAFNTTASASTSSTDLTGTSSGQQTHTSTTSSKLVLLRDSIQLSTFLCSNKFTQKSILVKVLNWKTVIESGEDGFANLLAALDQFTFIGETEIVKFLGQSLDALLDILGYEVRNNNRDNDELVLKEIHEQAFASIVWLLGIVQDRRFSNFKPVLNVYIKQRFQPTNNWQKQYTYVHLIKSLVHLLETPEEPSKAKLLRSSMKVWEYLFRFIVRSRQCHQKDEEVDERSENDSKFFSDIEQLLDRIRFIMDTTHPNVMIGTQTITLQHFSEIVNELYRIFPIQRLVHITVAFVDHCSSLTGRLVGFKLILIRNIVKGPLFNNPSCTPELPKHVLRWVNLWINSYMLTAKDVIFARKSDPAIDRMNSQQIRLPRNQWIENLRLSLTIISELLEKIRKNLGIMPPSGLMLSGIPSPSSSSTYSRPTSFTATLSDQTIPPLDSPSGEYWSIIQECLQIIPQLMNAYKDLQKLTIQAIHISGSSADSNKKEAATNVDMATPVSSRRQSRQSLSPLRERSSSLNSSNLVSGDVKGSILSATDSLHSVPSGNLLQRTSSLHKTATLHQMGNVLNDTIMESDSSDSNNSTFTIILKALSTSPSIPFPSNYPFQSAAKTINQKHGLTKFHDIMITTGLLDLSVVFLDLFHMTPHYQWVAYVKQMKEQEGASATIEFLKKVIYTCMGILFGDNVRTLERMSLSSEDFVHIEEDVSRETRGLPEKWLNLSIIAHRVILCDILEPISTLFELPDFTPSEAVYVTVQDQDAEMYKNTSGSTTAHNYNFTLPNEDPAPSDELPSTNANISMKTTVSSEQKSLLLLWRMYCMALLRIIGCPSMEVPKFMPQRQRAVWKIIGNMRSEVGCKAFLFIWHLAGKNGRPCIFDRYPTKRFTSCSVNSSSTQQLTDVGGSDYFYSPVSAFEQRHFSYNDPQRNSIHSVDKEIRGDNNNTDNLFSPYSNFTRSNVRNSMRIWPTDNLLLSSVSEERQPFEESSSGISLLQANLAYFIISPLLGISLTLHDSVRASGLSVIADIIALELYNFGELSYAQHVLISTLDRLIMSEQKGDESLCIRIRIELFSALECRLLTDDRRDLITVGKIAVESLCTFLSLLFQIRSLPQEEEFMDDRITATLKILKFIQVIEREEIYIKYIHQLVQLHLDNRNFVEAALTLKYHADLLQWEPQKKLAAIPDLKLPLQSSFERKESLYMKMLNYCDRGNDWELCIKLCKELSYEYENTIYNYTKLADILQRQAEFVKNIARKERCFVEYYRVGFYGKGFPRSTRNCQYIYRGLEWEKISSFIERLQDRHPNAQLLPAKIANTEYVSEEQLKELNSSLDGQFLQITPVMPIPSSERNSMLTNPLVPDTVKAYYASNDVSRFSFSRPVSRNADNDTGSEPVTEFLKLWTEKIEFECEDTFPTIVRRSRVIKTNSTLISPIENAVVAMEAKNKELISLERKYSAFIPQSQNQTLNTVPPMNVNPFSMSVNGAVDAPVNGGVFLYKKAFLTKEFRESNPDLEHWIYRLRSAINDQVIILQKCLDTHSKIVSNEMKPFHNTMVELFKKNFADELKVIKADAAKELKERSSVTLIPTRFRQSTAASSTSDNRSMSDIQSFEEYKVPSLGLSRQDTSTQYTIPALPILSPISRAFSIQALTLDSPNDVHRNDTQSFDKANASRADNFSRSLKLSLNKKSRKKAKSIENNNDYHHID